MQALLLLAKRDNGSGRMLHCWQLVGSATRMVIDLGLHRQSTMMSKNTETTYGQIETRRRVFWQSYIMDKSVVHSLLLDSDRPDGVPNAMISIGMLRPR